MVKIAHLTSAHNRYDTRIFIKMCTSLVNSGYDVSLVVADGLGDETKNGVKIIDAGATTGGRLNRMTKTVENVFEKAQELNADLYHLHDPELLQIVSKIKKRGKKVIFDAHEDVPKQILSKPYLNKFTALIIAKTIEFYEKKVCKKVDYIVAATSSIRDKFRSINNNSIDVNNYPMPDELFLEMEWNNKLNEICYIGSLSRIRGITEDINALELFDNCILNVAGDFNEDSFCDETKSLPGWKRVNHVGFITRESVKQLIANSKAGLVTFLPVPNHIDAQPNKMFEYMSAGIPVISSNFLLWKEIIEGNNCGICVNPESPLEIAEAIKYLVNNDEIASAMGKNGRQAVIEKYNWENEEKKLIQIYERLLGN